MSHSEVLVVGGVAFGFDFFLIFVVLELFLCRRRLMKIVIRRTARKAVSPIQSKSSRKFCSKRLVSVIYDTSNLN